MSKTIILLISICSLTLITLNSCTVDCEYVCEGYPKITGWAKDIRKSECEDCDFPRVDEFQSEGYICDCYVDE